MGCTHFLTASKKDGAIVVTGAEILAVGQRESLLQQFPDATMRNFHEAAIVLGFVNTHSHLELSAMRGFLDQDEQDFPEWLKKLTRARVERMTSDDLFVSAAWGACEAVRAGVTCVGDASSAAIESMSALRAASVCAE